VACDAVLLSGLVVEMIKCWDAHDVVGSTGLDFNYLFCNLTL
jgi:hypothetical protein